MDFGKRIASAGTIAGLTEPQILAIGGAMASVGVEAEAGGTAVQKVLNAMTKSVAQGGEKLEIFARTAGLSAADFQRAFREDAAGAFASFVTGLGQQGDAAFTTLDGLTLGNERVVRSFLSLAAKITTLTDALALGTTAWEENTALAREADIRFETTASQLKLLANQVVEAGRALGDILKSILQTVVGIVREQVVPWLKAVVDRFKALSPEVQQSRVLWLGVAAAVGPALIALGGLVAVLTPLVPLFFALGKMTVVTTALASLRTMLVAVGLAAPAAAAGVAGMGAAATRTTAAVNTTTLSLARLRLALLTQLPTFTRWGRAMTGAAATVGTAMSGLATGAGVKLAGAFGGLKVAAAGLGGALTMLGPAAAIVATGFASWKLGRWIGETTGLTDAIERAALKLQGFTDEEIRTVQESRKLLEETEKLRASFEEFAAPLEALAAKDMAAWTNATKEAKGKARELADALPLAEIKVEHLSRAVHEFAAEGKLTPRVMREIGRQAQGLGLSLDELPPELRNIVTWLNRTAAAATEAGPPVNDLGEGMGGLSDRVQRLVDQFSGAALLAAARDTEAAIAAIGGVATLTRAETDALATQYETLIAKFTRVGGRDGAAVVAHFQALRNTIPLASQSVRELTARFGDGAFGANTLGVGLVRAMRASRGLTEEGLIPSRVNVDVFRLAMHRNTLVMGNWITQTKAGTTATARLGESFAGFGQQIGQTFARALEGGGQWLGAMQSLGVQAGDRLGTFLSKGLGKRMTVETGFLSKGLGKVLGDAAGMAIPLIGPVIGGLVGKLFSLGGPSKAELAGRQTAKRFRDGVIQTLTDGQLAEASKAALGAWRGNEQGAQFLIGVRDAYLAVGRSAGEAEAMVNRLWAAEARGPEAVAAVQRELQGVLDQADALAEAEGAIVARHREIADGLSGIVDAGQAAFDPAQLDPYLAQLEELGLLTTAEAAALRQMADDAHVDWRAMEESAKQYGVAMKTVIDENGNEVQVFDESLLGLGHAQAKLSDEAGQLASAWTLLTGEGTNTQVAIEGMTDEAQAFVTQALEMGIALPESMRPMLDAMVEQGRLTDANGDKLTDLSGLTFAAPIAAGFDLLADKIQLLIITLGGPSGLSKAVEDMVASASLDIKDLAGEWSGMTDAMKADFGSFEAFVEDQALRDLAADAGLNYDAIAAKWKGMTDEQQAAFGTFREFMKNEELKQLATDAGLTFDDLEQQWKDMTDAQRTEAESFRAFVNGELDKIEDKTVTVTTRYVTEGAPAGGRHDDAEGFQHGSPFRHFGRGTPAMLHGLERVMTGAEGRGIQAALARIQQGLGAIADLSGVRALAKGGLVTRPTLTTFAEHGPEVGIPLERLEEFGGGRRVEAKLDQLHQDFALLIDEFRHGLDPRRRERAVVAAAALSTA